MVIKIDFGNTISRIQGLPKNINRYISDASGEFMKDVQKSAKLRAPFDTKTLKKGIVLEKTKNGWDLIANSRQAAPQEFGFRPHWIHSDQIIGSKKLTREGWFWVKKNKPFMTPALEHNLSNLPRILKSATKKAIAKRGG